MLIEGEISPVLRFLRIKSNSFTREWRQVYYSKSSPLPKSIFIGYSSSQIHYDIALYCILYITSPYTCVYKLYIILYHPTLLADFIVVITSVTSDEPKKKKRLYSSQDGSYLLNWLYESSSRGVTQVFLLICTVRGSRWFVGFSCTRRTCWLRVLLLREMISR